MNKSVLKWVGIGAAAAGAGLLLCSRFFRDNYFFEINTYRIGDTNSKDLIRLVQLSDLHFKRSYSGFYKRLARKVNELKPDLIIITGDMLDTDGLPWPLNRFFDQLDSHIPKAAVLGNHDHASSVSLKTLKYICESHHCDLLINQSKKYQLGSKNIMVTGLDDMIKGLPSFSRAVQEVGLEDPHILLLHTPLQQESVQKELKKINLERNTAHQVNISYIFAGHNHGGQIRFLNFAPVLPKKSGHYVNGWYNSHSPYLYVSKGIGTTALP
ncbi:MAG TPA: metallophosphoesterase, partial [Flavisolibacter sp.]|nr:metallophosphoesterase [Flavisolibacter sp.]